jgi:hypothetical protein
MIFSNKNKHVKKNYYNLFARVILMRFIVSVKEANLNHFFLNIFWFKQNQTTTTCIYLH